MAAFDEHLWAHLVEEHGADKVVLQTSMTGRSSAPSCWRQRRWSSCFWCSPCVDSATDGRSRMGTSRVRCSTVGLRSPIARIHSSALARLRSKRFKGLPPRPVLSGRRAW